LAKSVRNSFVFSREKRIAERRAIRYFGVRDDEQKANRGESETRDVDRQAKPEFSTLEVASSSESRPQRGWNICVRGPINRNLLQAVLRIAKAEARARIVLRDPDPRRDEWFSSVPTVPATTRASIRQTK